MTASRIAQLQELLKSEPTDSFLNYGLALEYAKENNQLKAIEIMEGILERDVNYLGAYYQLAQIYEQTKQVEKARLTYTKGIEIARAQKNNKAAGELRTALDLLDD